MSDTYRKPEQIMAPPPPHMVGDGFRVHNFFPGGRNFELSRMSPFFLMDYNSKYEFPPSAKPRGVGVHPHRGFETVTIAYQGKIAHHDSYGNSGVIDKGGVQWMTAGSGVLHKEYHEKEFSKNGGPFQMVQLWVNLPAEHKMTGPKYQAINAEDMGIYSLPNNGGRAEVIAGAYKSVKGPASTFTPINMFNLKLNKGTEESFELNENHNAGMLVVEGNVSINGNENAAADHFVLFENKGEKIKVRANENSTLLVLSGEPIHEPIFAHGPFLMNTRAEIVQAFEDLEKGKFGQLEESI
ncbi:MAG: pirin family protein [Chitinophagales bacterium]